MRFHQVQPGDTLSDIAVKYKADWKALSKKNRLTDPNKLQPGDIIMIPDAPPPPSPDPAGDAEAAMPKPRRFEQPAPYKTSWPKDMNPGSNSVPMTATTDKPKTAKAKPGLSAEGTKPYPPINYDAPPMSAERLGSIADQWSSPERWKEWFAQALPTALMAMPSGGRVPAIRPAAGGPFSPAQQAWLAKQEAFFAKNPGAKASMDPNYYAAREAGLGKPGTTSSGGKPTPEGQAADAKDWNFYRRLGKDSKSVPFPRKNEPVRETYSAANEPDVGPGPQDFFNAILRKGAEMVLGLPEGGGGAPYYNPDVIAMSTRLRPLFDQQKAQANGEDVPASGGAFMDFLNSLVEGQDKLYRQIGIFPIEGGVSSRAKNQPGADYPKNVSPFTSAIRGGMDRADAAPSAGTQIAGMGYVPGPEVSQDLIKKKLEEYGMVDPVEEKFQGVLRQTPGGTDNTQPEAKPYDPMQPPNRLYPEGYEGFPRQDVGDVIPFKKPLTHALTQEQKYNLAWYEQQLDRLLKKPNWTGADIDFAVRLVGPMLEK